MISGFTGNKKTIVLIGLIIVLLVVLVGIWKITDLQYLIRPADQSEKPTSKKNVVADITKRTAPVVIRKKIMVPAERIASTLEPSGQVDIKPVAPSVQKPEIPAPEPEIKVSKQAEKPEPFIREEAVAPEETTEQPEVQETPAPTAAVANQKSGIAPEVKKQPVVVIAPKTVATAPVAKAALRPYTIMLASCKLQKSADVVMSKHRKLGLAPYIVKVDLGDKGEWLRILAGHFENQEAALEIKAKNRLTGAKIVKMPYANLIGSYPSKNEAAGVVENLENIGYYPYFIDAAGGSGRLFVGAFITREGAQHQKTELHSKGIPNQVVER